MMPLDSDVTGRLGGRRVLVLTERPDWHTPRLLDALERRGVPYLCAAPSDCGLAVGLGGTGLAIPGFETELPAGVFVRAIGRGTFEQVTLRLGVLHALVELGVPVYNGPRAIERCVDKSITSFLLARAGLPTPPAIAVQGSERAAQELPRLGGEVVAKPLFGAQGRGLKRLEEAADLPGEEEMSGVYYLQRYVPPRREGDWHDWRVFVVGERAAAAMVRRGRSWITNVHQGATAEPAPSEGEHADLAVAAARAVGADYAGVDLIRGADGRWQVLEVNSMPAWQGLQKVTPVDIGDALIADFTERVLGLAPASAVPA